MIKWRCVGTMRDPDYETHLEEAERALGLSGSRHK
jgi:hypothetical protein